MKNTTLTESVIQETLEIAPIGTAILDEENKIAWINHTLAEFLNQKPADVIGKTIKEFEHSVLEPKDDEPDLYHLPPDAGRPQRWLYANYKELKTDKAYSQVCYYVDVTEIMSLRVEANSLSQQLENTNPTDSLTGLLNQRALNNALDRQVSRSRRYHNPLSVIVMHIKSFAAKQAGAMVSEEEALKSLSYFLRDQMRWVDLVGRTGTDEFTLILPETNGMDAQRLAEKLIDRLENVPLSHQASVSISVAVYFGITSWSKGDDSRSMLKRVKTALDKAKKEANANFCYLGA